MYTSQTKAATAAAQATPPSSSSTTVVSSHCSCSYNQRKKRNTTCSDSVLVVRPLTQANLSFHAAAPRSSRYYRQERTALFIERQTRLAILERQMQEGLVLEQDMVRQYEEHRLMWYSNNDSNSNSNGSGSSSVANANRLARRPPPPPFSLLDLQQHNGSHNDESSDSPFTRSLRYKTKVRRTMQRLAQPFRMLVTVPPKNLLPTEQGDIVALSYYDCV
ncbi:hypothetical protein BCR43DRAFT_482986 [Syncephalastrum racemosum]|uniref:Uncharacterized protein n=1 Tax=Syncephalastrum racemosum TaxID=13706 RepID=A0A1X2HUK4_SYNRA|nr:hypothetical protein BCR43DRAFT_482986 [Syncephalastrum racemosum]